MLPWVVRWQYQFVGRSYKFVIRYGGSLKWSADYAKLGAVSIKRINVVGAVIVRAGKILCAQRGPSGNLGGMWEVPGGKIEADETPREALVREIDEELLCKVVVGDEVTTTTYDYDFGRVTLTTFWCELLDGEPSLTEHDDVVWLSPEELPNLDWAPADRPAVELIVKQCRPI